MRSAHTAARAGDTKQRPPQSGQALIEVLAALVLFVVAAAIVASAATTNVRSMRAAAARGRLVALAASELARLQVRTTPGTSTEIVDAGVLLGSGLRADVTRVATIDEAGALATLAVAVATQPPEPDVRLTTRVWLPW